MVGQRHSRRKRKHREWRSRRFGERLLLGHALRSPEPTRLIPLGHGTLALSLNNTSCCGTFAQTHVHHVHLSRRPELLASCDFRSRSFQRTHHRRRRQHGLANRGSDFYGGAGRLEATRSRLTGFSGALNAAGGTGLKELGRHFHCRRAWAISGGIFDTRTVGRRAQLRFRSIYGTFTAPDANGRGTLTFTTNGGTNLRLLHRDAGSFAADGR